MRKTRAIVAALGAALLLAGCAGNTPDDRAVCDAHAAGRSHREVVADGTVTRVFGIRPGRVSPHDGFLMRLNSACHLVVRVEANTDFTGPIPLANGDRAVVRGEYEYYAAGGVIHWTHRDPRGRHEGGYVQVHGTIYD